MIYALPCVPQGMHCPHLPPAGLGAGDRAKTMLRAGVNADTKNKAEPGPAAHEELQRALQSINDASPGITAGLEPRVSKAAEDHAHAAPCVAADADADAPAQADAHRTLQTANDTADTSEVGFPF